MIKDSYIRVSICDNIEDANMKTIKLATSGYNAYYNNYENKYEICVGKSTNSRITIEDILDCLKILGYDESEIIYI